MNKLLRHLNYCASEHGVTNMTAKNLAIVWAPNLLRPNCDDSVAALTEFRTQVIFIISLMFVCVRGNNGGNETVCTFVDVGAI